ncbi:MAG: NUDIX hydrolase [Nevskiales bacterium]
MKYCSRCGHEVEFKLPRGDHLSRYVCPACGTIHYQNPRLVVGCIPQWQDRILLCKRAIEPRLGYWTLPAGFMENGETTRQAAARETLEEAHAKVEIDAMLSLISVPYIHQVHAFYLARLLTPEFAVSAESSEVRLYSEGEIPWDDIAFPTVGYTLRRYFADRKAGVYTLHMHDILTRPPAPRLPD